MKEGEQFGVEFMYDDDGNVTKRHSGGYQPGPLSIEQLTPLVELVRKSREQIDDPACVVA